MTAKELILMDSRKVRSDSDLMRIYKDLYREQFGKVPDCAGCTFNTDWSKFVAAVSSGKNPILVTSKKSIPMEANTYVLKKKEGKILSFQKDKKTYRAYDTKASQEFLAEYLTHGTPEELASRRKMFSKAPKAEVETPVEKPNKKKGKTAEPVFEPEIVQDEPEDDKENL